MGNLGWTQILVVALLVLVFFGRGKISNVMGEVGKGITNFRKGLKDESGDKAANTIDVEAEEKDKTTS